MSTTVQETRPTPPVPGSPKVLKALGQSSRVKILVFLHQGRLMSFTDLAKTTGMDGPVLTHHLDKLKDAELIQKRSNPDPDSSQYRMYEVTEFGERMLKTLDLVHDS